MINPTTVEFLASPDHDVVNQTVPVLSRYDVEIYRGDSLVKVQPLGKPTSDTNGRIIHDQFGALLDSVPAGDYVVKVSAVGPGGKSRSASSDLFTVMASVPIPRPPGIPILVDSSVPPPMTVAQEITAEATAPNSETSHPLPLMALWQAGRIWHDYDPEAAFLYFSPLWQLDMIAQGHHILPTFIQPDWVMLDPAESSNGSLLWTGYYQTAIAQCAALQLPICFVGTQWEQYLYTDSAYLNLSYANNANMAHVTTGAPSKVLSAFGAIPPWMSIGTKWTSARNQVGGASMLSIIQGWYPNPPLVVFLSNNEAAREQWSNQAGPDVQTDKHYVDLHGTGQSDDFKREKVGDGWIARYTALRDAMRAALPSGSWRTNAKFIAYENFDPRTFGYSGWKVYSLYHTNRISPAPLMFDGSSPSYYNNLNGWDSAVQSPQYLSMNYPFMLDAAYSLNPTFWFELATWPSTDYFPLEDTPPGASEAQALLAHDPEYTPARYGGMVQYGMWLTRPRVVRPFMHNEALLAESQVYFDAVMAAVDRVYTNATLRPFWRQSTLVENAARPNFYSTEIPTEYAAAARSFLLSTTLDPNGGDPTRWTQSTILPVYALARVRGSTPNRQWLVYAFSPKVSTSPTVTIPGYGNIAITSTVAGAFYLVHETTGMTALGTGD